MNCKWWEKQNILLFFHQMAFLLTYSTDEDTRSTYIDMWGYEINWHDLEDGWTIERRGSMSKIEEMMRYQMQRIPGLTKTGYKKIKMSKTLHHLILKARQTNNITYPECESNWAMYNCQRVTKEGKIGK